MLKHGPNSMVEQLVVQFNSIWKTQEIPDDWTKGIIVKLPKNGSLSDCNNWWGITLLSTPGKAFTRVMLNRLQDTVDQTFWEGHAGFRKGRSWTEQIFALRNILEQSVEYRKDLVVNFIDFKKAFDSVYRPALWTILKHYCMPDRYLHIFKALYNKSSCCVKMNAGVTDFFDVVSGVRQGCILSPFLFIMVIVFVIRWAVDQLGFSVDWQDGKRLTDLDIALIAENDRVCQEMTTRQGGLHISQEKSKITKTKQKKTKIDDMCRRSEARVRW